MSKNLRQELRTAVFNSFLEGTSKRGVKSKGDGADRTFSYASRGQLLDRVNDFSVYCKSQGIYKISHLSQDIATAYLEHKATTCSQATLDEYRFELRKLGKICHIDLSPAKVLAKQSIDTHRGASAVISREDFAKLIEYCCAHPSLSATALLLEAEIGVRVSDLTYGITVNEAAQRLEIRCKNGKMLYRSITPPIRALIASDGFQNALQGSAYRPVKDSSLNTYLRRTQDRLGLERHSMHDIRRRIAQDRYDELRSTGMSRTDCLKAVSLWLNHGEKRDAMLLKSYINDAW